MADWRIEFSKEAVKNYNKLEKGYQRKVDDILYCIKKRERIDIKPVEGEKDIYRLRVGKYRILIQVVKERKIILVIRIRTRGDVYK